MKGTARWRLAARVVGVVSGVLAPTVAFAQDAPPPPPIGPAFVVPAPPDSVVLRNGGLVRGRIQEILPGDHLTITLDTGETRRIAWAEVERVIVAATTKIPPMPKTTEVPSAAPSAPPPPPPPMRGPLVWVHITSPKHVTLNRRLDEGADWVRACDSPCDVELPIADEYEIAGLGNGPTKEFRIQAAPGRSVVLTIEPPSLGGIILGGGLVALGGIALYVSVVVGLATAATCVDESCGTNGGYVAAGVSAGAMAAGGIILYFSAKTDISQHESGATAAPAPQAAFLPEPTWHVTPDALPRAGAPAFMVPLFSRSF